MLFSGYQDVRGGGGVNPTDVFSNVGYGGPGSLAAWVNQQLGQNSQGMGGGFGAGSNSSSPGTLPSRPIFQPGTQGTALPGATPGSMPSLGPSMTSRILNGMDTFWKGYNQEDSQGALQASPLAPEQSNIENLLQMILNRQPTQNMIPQSSYPEQEELMRRGMIPGRR